MDASNHEGGRNEPFAEGGEASQQQMQIASDVPEGIPQAVPFVGKKQFYVRECYPAHYEHLLNLLKSPNVHYVSVTGTPGIGKSTFYLYFYKRYRAEHPQEKIVLASFTKKRELEECRVSMSALEDIVSSERIPAQADLYLYDGPPNKKHPQFSGGEMIAFTCPNQDWFASANRDESHAKRHMPIWEFAELQRAVTELELDITEDTLQERFSLFGGTARYILTENQEFVDSGKKDIDEALGKIDSFHHVQQCFECTMDLDQVVHRLMHYVIDDPNRLHLASLVPASEQISIKMYDRLSQKQEFDRAQLAHWLDGNASKASIFWAWVFENYVHELFGEGGTFRRRDVAQNSVADFLIPIQDGCYRRFGAKLELDQLFRDVYYAPKASTLKAVDSYIILDAVIVLFQITTNPVHPVAAEGIIGLLKKLKMLDAVKNGTMVVQLVFVVPSSMRDTYPTQQIENRTIFDRSLEEIRATDCSVIPYIGNKRKIQLNAAGIHTVGDVLHADINAETRISSVRQAVRKFRQEIDDLQDVAFLDSIDQSVIGVEFAPSQQALKRAREGVR